MTPDDGTPIGHLLAVLDEQKVYVDSANQKHEITRDRWRVQVRAVSKYDAKAYSYFPGSGPSFYDALRQAAVNAGAYSDRGPGAEESAKPVETKRASKKTSLLE